MRDGAVLLIIFVVLIGSVGWLIVRANGITLFAEPAVVVEPFDEGLKEEPPLPLPPRPAAKPRLEAGAAFPSAPAEMLPAPPKAIHPAPTFPYPSIPQIQLGFEKSNVTQMYGDPSLTATTGGHGHTFDTFVYHRNRGDSMTIIRFQDGRVYAARATP